MKWSSPIVVIAVALLVWMLLGPEETPAPSASSSNIVLEGYVSSEGEVFDDPTPTYSEMGQEGTGYEYSAEDQQKALETASKFVAGWLNPNVEERHQELAGIASKELARKLESARTWNTTPQSDPTISSQNVTTITVEQQFTDGRGIVMLMAYDETWTVVDVEPKEK